MADAKSSESTAPGTREHGAGPFGLPELDLQALFAQFAPPGLDLSRFLEAERRNLEALGSAQQAMVSGWQALAEQQAGVLRDALEAWQRAAERQFSGTPLTPEEQLELARKGFEQILGNLRDAAQQIAQSQEQALEILRKRTEESIRSFFGAPPPT
jgi:phasin family protein